MLYVALILLFAACCVVVVEFFVPSAGVLGLLAGGLGIAAIWVGFMDGLASGALIMVLAAIAVPTLFFSWLRIWPHTPIGRRILQGEIKAEDILPNDVHYTRLASLKGQIGVAKSKMLPSGQVLINGEKFDATSDGFAIEQGDRIIVSDIRGNRVYVEPYEGDDPEDDDPDVPARDREILEQPIEELGLDSIDDLLS